MSIKQGIFGDTSNFAQRYIQDFEQLTIMVTALRELGATIVLTSGSFDMVHEGHVKYLEQAKAYGDVLVVGVDCDEKIRSRKGPDRPIVPELERLQMLTHFRPVDIVTLKNDDGIRWQLIDAVRPDVLVVTEDTYSGDIIRELENDGHCARVQVLERMAETSTTARIRGMRLDLGAKLTERLSVVISRVIEETIADVVGPNE